MTCIEEWEMAPAVRFKFKLEDEVTWRDAYAFVRERDGEWEVMPREVSWLQERKRQYHINNAQIAVVHQLIEESSASTKNIRGLRRSAEILLPPTIATCLPSDRGVDRRAPDFSLHEALAPASRPQVCVDRPIGRRTAKVSSLRDCDGLE